MFSIVLDVSQTSLILQIFKWKPRAIVRLLESKVHQYTKIKGQKPEDDKTDGRLLSQ